MRAVYLSPMVLREGTRGPRGRLAALTIISTPTRPVGAPDCPNEVDQKQLDELHLSIRYPEGHQGS